MITCHKIQCLAILWHYITLTPSCNKPNNKSLFIQQPEKYEVISVKMSSPQYCAGYFYNWLIVGESEQ